MIARLEKYRLEDTIQKSKKKAKISDFKTKGIKHRLGVQNGSQRLKNAKFKASKTRLRLLWQK